MPRPLLSRHRPPVATRAAPHLAPRRFSPRLTRGARGAAASPSCSTPPCPPRGSTRSSCPQCRRCALSPPPRGWRGRRGSSWERSWLGCARRAEAAAARAAAARAACCGRRKRRGCLWATRAPSRLRMSTSARSSSLRTVLTDAAGETLRPSPSPSRGVPCAGLTGLKLLGVATREATPRLAALHAADYTQLDAAEARPRHRSGGARRRRLRRRGAWSCRRRPSCSRRACRWTALSTTRSGRSCSTRR